MDPAIVLAKFWGLLLVAIFGPFVINKRIYNDLMESVRKADSVFLYSLVAILLGALSVAMLNTWTLSYKGVITALGWISLIKGLMGLMLPKASMELADRVRKHWPIMFLMLLLSFLLGIWLLYVGFLSAAPSLTS
jgi:hypothetical protein